MIGLTFHPLKYNKFHTVVLLSISFFPSFNIAVQSINPC